MKRVLMVFALVFALAVPGAYATTQPPPSNGFGLGAELDLGGKALDSYGLYTQFALGPFFSLRTTLFFNATTGPSTDILTNSTTASSMLYGGVLLDFQCYLYRSSGVALYLSPTIGYCRKYTLVTLSSGTTSSSEQYDIFAGGLNVGTELSLGNKCSLFSKQAL
jgi:hypothetical protein